MASKSADPELQHPFKAWQFWLIVFTAVLYFADIIIQWVVFKSVFESVTSGLLFIILAAEVQVRIKNKKSYLGEKYTLIFSLVLLTLLAFLYLSQLL